MELPVETLNRIALLSAEERLVFAEVLGAYVAHLIKTDLHQLVQLLYRVDVDERKLKPLLGNNSPPDATLQIAELMIERQLRKSANRRGYPPEQGDW